MLKKSSNFVKIKYAPPEEKVEKTISTYLKRLKPKINLKLAVLFGSYSKGNYSHSSDVDILIVADNLPKNKSERFTLLMDVNLNIEIQPFGYSTEEFEKMLAEKNPFIAEILKTGKILFSKSS